MQFPLVAVQVELHRHQCPGCGWVAVTDCRMETPRGQHVCTRRIVEQPRTAAARDHHLHRPAPGVDQHLQQYGALGILAQGLDRVRGGVAVS